MSIHLYLLLGDDDVEKSRLAARVRGAGRRGAARRSTSIASTPATSGPATICRQGRIVMTAARTLPMMAPRRVVARAPGRRAARSPSARANARRPGARRRSRARCSARPEPSTVLVLVAGTIDRRSRMFKQLAETRDDRRVRRPARDPADRRALGTQVRRRPAAPQIEPAAARLVAQRAGTDIEAAAQRRRAPAALCARDRRRSRSTTRGDGRSGGPAGRLGDDQCHRGGRPPWRCANWR